MALKEISDQAASLLNNIEKEKRDKVCIIYIDSGLFNYTCA